MLRRTQVSGFVEEETRHHFAELAKRKGRSTSSLIRDFVEAEVKKEWIKQAAQKRMEKEK